MESWGRSRRYTKTVQRIGRYNLEEIEVLIIGYTPIIPSTDLSSSFDYDYVDVGYWSPLFGFVSKDVLFPHISHKFRNISLNVITYHVNKLP